MPIREELSAAVGALRGAAAADRLCEACVELLDVDAAAVSLIVHGANAATLGASSAAARVYDELQFTLGHGPCLDCVAQQAPVLVPDLADSGETRWPAYTSAMLALRIGSVFTLPVALAGDYIAALDLYRDRASTLAGGKLTDALTAAELATKPLMDLLGENPQAAIHDAEGEAWTELSTLTRVEIDQATGILIAQLGINMADASLRLRAHAYAANRSTSDVAHDILHHDLRLDIDP